LAQENEQLKSQVAVLTEKVDKTRAAHMKESNRNVNLKSQVDKHNMMDHFANQTAPPSSYQQATYPFMPQGQSLAQSRGFKPSRENVQPYTIASSHGNYRNQSHSLNPTNAPSRHDLNAPGFRPNQSVQSVQSNYQPQQAKFQPQQANFQPQQAHFAQPAHFAQNPFASPTGFHGHAHNQPAFQPMASSRNSRASAQYGGMAGGGGGSVVRRQH